MRDILVNIAGEWHDYIMGFMAIVLYIVFFGNMCAIKKILKFPENLEPHIGYYCLFEIYFCLYIIDTGFYFVNFFLDTFPLSTWIVWIMIFGYNIYAYILFYSICRISTYKPQALRLTRLLLLSVPSFLLLFPYFCFSIGLLFNKSIHTIDIYVIVEPWEDFFIGCIFSIPWILYFSLSSTMKSTWRYIDREYKKFHEGVNYFPEV